MAAVALEQLAHQPFGRCLVAPGRCQVDGEAAVE
jgi:hypothetical protein